jgi:PAS domain S-box-containing protein
LVTQRTAEIAGINQELELKLKELSASEERFRSLVMTIPDIVYRIDREGYFIFLNDAIQKLGFRPAELMGKHFNQIMMPEDFENCSRRTVLPKYTGQTTGDRNAPKLFDERRSGDRKTIGLEVRLVVKGDKRLKPGMVQPIGEEVIPVEVNSSGLWEINPKADKKEFIGTVGVIRDITDRKETENKLKERTSELQTIVNAMSGREVRMAQLKETIRKLRAQIEDAGLTPVADDPLKEGVISNE